MLRVVTPTFGERAPTIPTDYKLGDLIPNHHYMSRIQALLRNKKVSPTVRAITTIYSAEKHQFKLFVLNSSDCFSITPTRELVVDDRIVQKYRGPFPTPYRLPPYPALAVAYKVGFLSQQHLFVVGKRVETLTIDTTASIPRINEA